jgi:hypothetical protein
MAFYDGGGFDFYRANVSLDMVRMKKIVVVRHNMLCTFGHFMRSVIYCLTTRY